MNRLLILLLLCTTYTLNAQQVAEIEEETRGFKKENVFTGGSLTLQLGSGQFTAGVNPVLGYSLLRWVDAGLVFNYIYASAKNYPYIGDKIKQHQYGAGVFTRIFPVKFLFVQGQVEHNFQNIRYNPSTGVGEKYNEDGSSYLVGGGYTTGRDPDRKAPYFYVSILFDLGDDPNSPYLDNNGDPQPIYRAGVNIPLFQGKGNR